MVAAGALAAGSMLSPASAETYTHASGATVEAPATAVVNTTFTITGTKWTNIAGSAGSVIAVKFDAGAYHHKPGQEVKHPQTGATLASDIWDVFVAENDGSFTRTITLPTTANSEGKTPRPVGETYTVNMLSGSLGVQDQGRGVPLAIGVVAATRIRTRPRQPRIPIRPRRRRILIRRPPRRIPIRPPPHRPRIPPRPLSPAPRPTLT